MSQFMLITAVDIGVDLDRTPEQKKNYESLVQTLQLRTQIEPMITVKMSNKKAGSPFQLLNDRDPIWTIYFNVEQDYAYENDLETINKDLDYIPCIAGLQESRRIKIPYFKATGPDQNSLIKKHQLIQKLGE